MERKTPKPTKAFALKRAVDFSISFTLATFITVGSALAPATAITVITDHDSKVGTSAPIQPTSKIVGGSGVSITTAPWQVGLINRQASSNRGGEFCGGSLISNEWIVTAACW